MRKFTTFAAVVLALSSCTTTPETDAAVARNLTAACDALRVAYATYQPFAEAGHIGPKTAAKVNAVYPGVVILCTNPGAATGMSTVIRVASATAVIISALKNAQT